MKLQDLARREVDRFVNFSLPQLTCRDNPCEAAYAMLERDMEQIREQVLGNRLYLWLFAQECTDCYCPHKLCGVG